MAIRAPSHAPALCLVGVSVVLTALLFQVIPADGPPPLNVADPGIHPYADPAGNRDRYRFSGETVNELRLYDFYARQADDSMGRDEVPELLPAYPGLDAGLHGHWGKQFLDLARFLMEVNDGGPSRLEELKESLGEAR